MPLEHDRQGGENEAPYDDLIEGLTEMVEDAIEAMVDEFGSHIMTLDDSNGVSSQDFVREVDRFADRFLSRMGTVNGPLPRHLVDAITIGFVRAGVESFNVIAAKHPDAHDNAGENNGSAAEPSAVTNNTSPPEPPLLSTVTLVSPPASRRPPPAVKTTLL